MSNLPPIDTTIDTLKNTIVARYQEVAREFGTLRNVVSNIKEVDTDGLTAVVSQLKNIIKKLDTLNTLISRAQQTFKQKLVRLVRDIKTTGKNTSGTSRNLKNFINSINKRNGMFGFGTKWNVTNKYSPPRVVDMTKILQRMTKLRNDLQTQVQTNKEAANKVEVNKQLAEKAAANAQRENNKKTNAVARVESLLGEASTKLNAANKSIGVSAAAERIQAAYRAKQNRKLYSLD